MREIKFRGRINKGKNKGVWVYGYYYRINNQHLIVATGVYFSIDKKTVGQLTGAKDQNSKEVYEGDILKDDDICGKTSYSAVKFEWGAFWCHGGQADDFMFYRKVGNVSDNPELVEKNA